MRARVRNQADHWARERCKAVDTLAYWKLQQKLSEAKVRVLKEELVELAPIEGIVAHVHPVDGKKNVVADTRWEIEHTETHLLSKYGGRIAYAAEVLGRAESTETAYYHQHEAEYYDMALLYARAACKDIFVGGEVINSHEQLRQIPALSA